MHSNKRLWLALGVIFVTSFAVLLLMGHEIHQVAPPVPERVVSESGQVIYTREDIETGRQVWQRMGGHQLGSIWGHGGYVAPDWTADWLHREALALLNVWAQDEYGLGYGELDPATQGELEARLRGTIRPNNYDPQSASVTVSDDRAEAIAATAAHYDRLFSADPGLSELRNDYALAENPVPLAEDRRRLGAFFFWTAWAAVTHRPGDKVTYTANWPHDELVGNEPTAASFLWTFVSIVFLLAAIGALAWHHAVNHGREQPPAIPDADPLQEIRPTPSMKATAKYFWVVVGLFLLQILLGAITAHYAVEGQSFYGFNLAEILPYAVTRTWHTQLAVFWIATAWLAMGLYIAPVLSGHEPRFQRLGVNFLFVCLLLIVLGSMAGQWYAVVGKTLDLDLNFWFGHQGYEYVDLGRFWQIFLFIGLMLWLTLVGRALWPALKRRDDSRTLIWLVFLSTIAIGLFYGAGLMWGKHTHLSLIEYWRWWVVHLWVEGFFEVFATAVISLIFVRLGLVRATTATTAVLFATVVFLTGGILGTFHHLYFTGTPTGVIALGASFSALEVVPLVFVGFEAYENYRHLHMKSWVQRYKWPILFFIAVAFWNLVGAGLFGFLINTPLALFYMQGLNTTPLHGHTALFGVYGMLGIGLMLFCLRGLKPRAVWNEKLLSGSFWSLNLGLAGMALLCLLPMGLYQVYASVSEGFWYARSAEFVQQPLMHMFVWLRVPGDVLFSAGAVLLGWFVLRLWWPGRERRPGPAAIPATESAGSE